MLPHLHNGWQVDQAILSEEDRVIVIRFGHDWDPTCMKMDEVLYSIAEKVGPDPWVKLWGFAQRLTYSLCWTGEKFRCYLPGGHHRGAGLQQDVRAVRPLHRHVLLQVERPRHSCSSGALVAEPHVVRACVSGTNTSWLIWAPATTTRSTGRWRTSRRWLTLWRRCTEELEKDEVWWCRPRIILQNTDIDFVWLEDKNIFPVTKGQYLD